MSASNCSRMRSPTPSLGALYQGLLASEARHHGSYLELAVQASDESSARARLLELAEREAEIIADPSPMVRMHA